MCDVSFFFLVYKIKLLGTEPGHVFIVSPLLNKNKQVKLTKAFI